MIDIKISYFVSFFLAANEVRLIDKQNSEIKINYFKIYYKI